MITDGQCRAARALLKWTQGELSSKSGVTERTVRSFEGGVSEHYDRTAALLKRALEQAGIEFLSSEGSEGVLKRHI